jgi:hypothetical protein
MHYCTFSGCNKLYKKLSRLKEHYLKHTGEVAIKTIIINYTFVVWPFPSARIFVLLIAAVLRLLENIKNVIFFLTLTLSLLLVIMKAVISATKLSTI